MPEGDPNKDEAHPTSQPDGQGDPRCNQPAGGADVQTQAKNISSAGKQGRKRVYAEIDEGLEIGLVNISNSIATCLDNENENAKTMAGIGKALAHGVELQKHASENIKLSCLNCSNIYLAWPSKKLWWLFASLVETLRVQTFFSACKTLIKSYLSNKSLRRPKTTECYKYWTCIQ